MALEDICHSYDSLIPARLIKRYKRFLADVRFDDGTVETVHCPNSGSMIGCMEDDAPVMLSRAKNPKRRTRYTWELVQMGGYWIGINTLLPNKLIAEAARQRALPLFKDAVEVRSEVKVSEHTRLDLAVETSAGPLYVEMKNVTMTGEGGAIFPDAKTDRGAKHLRELQRLKNQGADAAIVFVVQRQDADWFGLAESIDPDYARTLREAAQAGVGIVAVQAIVSPETVCLWRELPTILNKP